jgi:hypothetical protein
VGLQVVMHVQAGAARACQQGNSIDILAVRWHVGRALSTASSIFQLPRVRCNFSCKISG